MTIKEKKEAQLLINVLEKQLVEVKYHLDGGRIESAAAKSEFVKIPAISLHALLTKLISHKTLIKRID